MSTIQAGFGRLEITPPLGVYMNGYFYERRVEGVLDPIYVNAVAFRDGEKSAVVMTLDLCLGATDTMQEWMRKIGEAAGIPADAVLLHCTHTHTAPCIRDPKDPSDPQYDAWLLRRLCDAAVLALKDCKPVTQVRSYEGNCVGVSYPRRLKMKDGRYQTWGITGDPEIECFASQNDESLRLVRILREQGEELVLVNFQTHPDNISGCMVSADYPGFLRNRVEEERPGTRCVYFNGTDGELIVHDYINGNDLPKYVRARWAGNMLAEFVLAHMEMTRPVEGAGVSFGTDMVVNRTKRDPSRIPEAERIIHIHEHGNELEELGPDWVATPLVAEAYVLRKLEEEQLDTVPIPIGAVAAGGIAFVGMAGEPFSRLGRQMREESPYPVTILCCKSNGNEGYYPTAEAYDQGGYEPANTRFPKGVGENLTRGIVDLLHRIHQT